MCIARGLEHRIAHIAQHNVCVRLVLCVACVFYVRGGVARGGERQQERLSRQAVGASLRLTLRAEPARRRRPPVSFWGVYNMGGRNGGPFVLQHEH